jgi:ribonuclease VapC
MIVDSSALIAILHDEPEREQFLAAISDAAYCAISAPTLLECSIVLKRFGSAVEAELHRFVREAQMVVVPFEKQHVPVADDAYRRYGRGSGSPARLNFGDCISYAISVVSGNPLLFKGNDFLHTDIVSAICESADPPKDDE